MASVSQLASLTRGRFYQKKKRSRLCKAAFLSNLWSVVSPLSPSAGVPSTIPPPHASYRECKQSAVAYNAARAAFLGHPNFRTWIVNESRWEAFTKGEGSRTALSAEQPLAP